MRSCYRDWHNSIQFCFHSHIRLIGNSISAWGGTAASSGLAHTSLGRSWARCVFSIILIATVNNFDSSCSELQCVTGKLVVVSLQRCINLRLCDIKMTIGLLDLGAYFTNDDMCILTVGEPCENEQATVTIIDVPPHYTDEYVSKSLTVRTHYWGNATSVLLSDRFNCSQHLTCRQLN